MTPPSTKANPEKVNILTNITPDCGLGYEGRSGANA
jgi:hypothetical protein